MANKKQVDVLLREFAKGRSIGQLEAITELGIGHLSSTISKMKLEYGIPVIKEWNKTPTGARYISYSMKPSEAQIWLDGKLKEVRGY